jgi:hypothetical protein
VGWGVGVVGGGEQLSALCASIECAACDACVYVEGCVHMFIYMGGLQLALSEGIALQFACAVCVLTQRLYLGGGDMSEHMGGILPAMSEGIALSVLHLTAACVGRCGG